MILIYLICIIIFFYLIYKVIECNNYEYKEGYENALDLLNKYRSGEVHLGIINNANDLELSIYPWTTKLYNIQNETPIKSIALYKPKLIINGDKYVKLGDMISLNMDYIPSNDEFILLIKKLGSDIKPPINYKLIMNFGNTNIPEYYYIYENLLNNKTNLSTIITYINNCVNSVYNLNKIINDNKPELNDKLFSFIMSKIPLKIGNARPVYLDTLYKQNKNLLQIPINATTLIKLPANLLCNIIDTNNNNYEIHFGDNINLNDNNNKQDIIKHLSIFNVFSKLDDTNIEFINIDNINIFNFINIDIIIDYLKLLCNDILNILNQNTNPDFIKYLNLADNNEGVNTILTTLSTISDSHDLLNNTVLSGYSTIHKNTLLGLILNIIFNYNKNIKYPVITFAPNQLNINIMSSNNQNILGLITGITNASSLNIIEYNTEILNKLILNINENNNENIKTILPNIKQLMQFQNAIESNTIDFFPLQIYEPIPPPKYKCLGHIFTNNTNDLSKIKTADNIACIPEQCIKEIREWRLTDKVFEYNINNKYWAIYKNPYVGTFICVDNPRLPEGKVCKVIACVAKCNAVEELQKADKCARQYYQINKSLNNTILQQSYNNHSNNIEENIYLDKIKKQNDNINSLKQRAELLQLNLDKADIINENKNKQLLQNYIDTQKRNINIVMNKLEKDKNTIKTNINIPTENINKILALIHNSDSLTHQQKQFINNNIINNITKLNNNIISQEQYNINLNKINKSCPQFDLSGLVKKDTVNNVCYGCNY